MARKKNENAELIELVRSNRHHIVVKIVGDTDLILNKKTDRVIRELTADDRKAQALLEKETANPWEDAVTSIHWRDPFTVGSKSDYSEAMFFGLLENNAPCLSAFGLKKSWGQSVVRNELDKYATKFNAQVNIEKKLIPITFAEYTRDIKPMEPPGLGKGVVTAKLHRFTGWSADIPVSYTGVGYSLKEILKIIDLAGFGLGIGSGTSSDYGRYHVEEVNA